MKKLNILLSVIAMSFMMAGCGGGSSSEESPPPSSTPTPPPVDDGMDFSGVTKVDKFFDTYYGDWEKGTYETTEEWENKREEDFAPINGEIVTVLPDAVNGGSTYDADTSTLTVEFTIGGVFNDSVIFESNIGDPISFIGASYNVYYDFTRSDIGDVDRTSTRTDTYVFNNVEVPHDLVDAGDGEWFVEDYHLILKLDVEPEIAQTYNIKKKITVRAENSAVYHYKDGFTESRERNKYPVSLVSIIVYDKNSGKELGKVVPK